MYERTIGVLQLRALISQIDVMFCCRPCSVALKYNRTLASVYVVFLFDVFFLSMDTVLSEPDFGSPKDGTWQPVLATEQRFQEVLSCKLLHLRPGESCNLSGTAVCWKHVSKSLKSSAQVIKFAS